MRSGTWKGSAILLLLLGAGGLAKVFALDAGTAAERAAWGDGEAIAELRAAGPAGVEELLALATAEPGMNARPEFQAALDGVCAQRDCAASHLYWYTDLAAAHEAARRSGRPILSLRLLGRLDEELSCANSRFFRAVLYANESVARRLREDFVLHWQSERPVPKVTVDFGDGRRLEGTVTGNSIHYVLDSRGRLVDALPGLYGPQAFLAALGRAEAEARRLADLPDQKFAPALCRYHEGRLASLKKELIADLGRIGIEKPELLAGVNESAALWSLERRSPFERPAPKPTPDGGVFEASQLAMTKSGAEGPLITQMFFGSSGDDTIEAIAGLHRDEARLDGASRRLLQQKLASWVGPEGLEESLGRFEHLLARDGVHNEYRMHVAIHAALSKSPEVPDLAKVDRWVYSELFLTPDSDPWLGLAPREVFAVMLPVADAAAEQVAIDVSR